jgi:hypothetical protein
MDRVQAAFAARDWAAMRAACANGARMEDRRRHALISGNADWWVNDAEQACAQIENLHVKRQLLATFGERVCLERTTWRGGPPEAPVEIEYLRLVEVDGAGKLVAVIGFDLDGQDAAKQEASKRRLAAEEQRASHDTLSIPPNAATRAKDRWHEYGGKRDWNGLRAAFAPGMLFEDRRRLLRITGDREMAVASAKSVFQGGAKSTRRLLATAGDQLALEHVRFERIEGGVLAFEVDNLTLLEADSEGRVVATITFDNDDRIAAGAEMLERFARSDAAKWIPPGLIGGLRALRAHDLPRWTAALTEDVVFHDHRRTGAGQLDAAADFVAYVRTLFEHSRDAMIEPLYYVAIEPHGMVTVNHTYGTLIDGGEFESVFVQTITWVGGHTVELFELEDIERARARLDELRP